MTKNTRKFPTSFRLSREAIGLADKVADKLGVSRTAVIEMSLRRMAEEELKSKRRKKSTS